MIDNLAEAIEKYKHFVECETESARVLREHGNVKDAKYFEKTAENDRKIVAWLTELQERREADKWIPVGERLPEPRVAVMVYCPEYKNQYYASYDNKQWKIFGSHVTIWDEVTCWRPLPKAPESEDK